MPSLVLSVSLHDARWHGAGEWPPSPARLFQALVAGIGGSGPIAAGHRAALEWLERQPSPVIAAPSAAPGRGFTNFVPHNDLDAVGGDPGRVGEIRAGKTIRPRLIVGEPAFRFVWTLEAGVEPAEARVICEIARSLYQFGRGVDMAWASAEILSEADTEALLAAHPGSIHRPSEGDGAGGVALRCPMPGTLHSLIERHGDQRRRIEGGVFRKPREARFRLVGYDCPPDRLLLELKPADDVRPFQPWPLGRAGALTMAVRDAAAPGLVAAGAERAAVERCFVGRGSTGADKARRVRIVPLPSIGHAHTDPSIRRVLVERPPDCPIPKRALEHALSNLDLSPSDPKTGEVLAPDAPVLAPAVDRDMLRHYGVAGRRARVWHSVTPMALPVARRRGRTSGSARLAGEAEAAHAVRQALRHAGIGATVRAIRLQREPFFAKGARAEAFAASRFEADRLWHVEITFETAIAGPLVLGDGRYCGLGVMACSPSERPRDVLILPIIGSRPALSHRHMVVAALRRALMSRAADGDGQVPTLFSGHEDGPGPARSGSHRHAYLFADDADADGRLDRLVVVAPWRVDRTVSPGSGDRERFERVVGGARVVRAGAAGLLTLGAAREPDEGEPLFAPAASWVSHTPYRPARHPARSADPASATAHDLTEECLRRGLPRPRVEIRRVDVGPRGGISAEAHLAFGVGIGGPILLGRDAHKGGGLFVGTR